eukprot:Unigene3972_Nuclearia_a/m.12076 Unigene3972_Nuclearia_a/g.12076  ORF Unigene3972_Nuclearia_a/g.12076 Unigene3972_Nuclearia_a/m.12076 type:complete len:313 (-) Unigene3972_Nuclearia_a:3514-4452(-)
MARPGRAEAEAQEHENKAREHAKGDAEARRVARKGRRDHRGLKGDVAHPAVGHSRVGRGRRQLERRADAEVRVVELRDRGHVQRLAHALGLAGVDEAVDRALRRHAQAVRAPLGHLAGRRARGLEGDGHAHGRVEGRVAEAVRRDVDLEVLVEPAERQRLLKVVKDDGAVGCAHVAQLGAARARCAVVALLAVAAAPVRVKRRVGEGGGPDGADDEREHDGEGKGAVQLEQIAGREQLVPCKQRPRLAAVVAVDVGGAHERGQRRRSLSSRGLHHGRACAQLLNSPSRSHNPVVPVVPAHNPVVRTTRALSA